MRKVILLLLLSFKLSFAINLPSSYGGTVISLQEYQQYTDYCFYTNSFILESAYDMSYNQIDFNYRLYDMQNGEIVLGYAEFILHCYTEQAAINKYGNTSIMNGKFQSTLKRGRTDRCLGLDWFDAYWNVYGCIPESGEWYVIDNSVGGSTNDASGTYDCYNPSTDDFYAGSSYLNLVLTKMKIFGVEYEDNFYYRTFNCVENDENVAINPTLTQLKTGLTTSRTASDIGSSGGSGNGSGDGETTAKLEEIKTDLEEIKTQTSTTQSQFLGKIADVENSILIQNENIAVSKADLEAKLNTIETKTNNLENEIKAKIEIEKENLKTDLIANDELKTNEIKSKIDDLENDLMVLNNSTNDEILALNDSISLYQTENINSKNEILTSLSALEGQIDSISNGSNSNDELISEMNQGISKIDETLKSNLQDKNGKPYLNSINETLKSTITPISTEDYNISQSQINSTVSNTLDNSFTKYSNILGFGSSYGSAPNNITVTLLGNTYTLLNFSVLDPYIDIIRSLFLSLAYLYGLMNFIRGEK